MGNKRQNIVNWFVYMVALAILFGVIGLTAGCDRTDRTSTPTFTPTTAPTTESSATPSTVPTPKPSAAPMPEPTLTPTPTPMPVPTTSATTATTTGPTTATTTVPGVGDVTVLAINVGRADAILIQAAGRSFLIDTGTKDSVPQLFRALNLRGVKALDAVFLTHAHGDHAGGLPSLAQGFSIGTLYSASIAQPDKDGNNKASEMAKELSLKHALLKEGDAVAIADGLAFEVIAPVVFNDQDDNDNSLVLRLRAHGRTVLLAGDMEFAEEKTLLQTGTPLKADVLKVANHGNPDATSDEFAAAVSPAYAIISTNTDDDPDSANSRVQAALGNARIMITQDFPCGVQMTIRADGAIQVANPDIPPKAAEIAITDINQDKQTVTLRNNGAAADLSGCFLISQKDSEVFVFPQGAALKPGQTAMIAGKAQVDGFHWPSDGKTWKGKKAATFILYDRHGNELSQMTLNE